MPWKGQVYYFDTREWLRWFPADLRYAHVPGDVTETPAVPAIVKSRPIAGDNAAAVLLNLNKVRHFIFVDRDGPFERKSDTAVFRGKVRGKPKRIALFERWLGATGLDLGDTSSRPVRPEWGAEKATIREQLRHKFVLCVEGNDVASNLKWVMSSNSIAVMPRPEYETWFQEGRLVPGVHYVEVAPDFSDLRETLDRYRARPDECARILEAAHAWVARFRDPSRERLVSLRVLDRYFRATRPAPPPAPPRRAGSALVLALVVVAVLSALLGSLAFEARLEAGYASLSRDRVKASALAESGVEIAKMLMARSSGAQGAPDGKSDDEDRWHDAVERLRAGQSLVGLVEPAGEGFVVLDIEPEPGRLNVNLLAREDWETILVNAGIPEEYVDYIVDPILDWTDEDDSPNSKGAETDDYYALLDPPYEARNGAFDTVRELLLVKGFAEPILTGGLWDPATLRDRRDAHDLRRREDQHPERALRRVADVARRGRHPRARHHGGARCGGRGRRAEPVQERGRPVRPRGRPRPGRGRAHHDEFVLFPHHRHGPRRPRRTPNLVRRHG